MQLERPSSSPGPDPRAEQAARRAVDAAIAHRPTMVIGRLFLAALIVLCLAVGQAGTPGADLGLLSAVVIGLFWANEELRRP